MSDIYSSEEKQVVCTICGNESGISFTRRYEGSDGHFCEMCALLMLEVGELNDYNELFHPKSTVQEAIAYLERKQIGSSKKLFPTVVSFCQ